MEAAVVILIIGMISAVLGIAEIKRTATQGSGVAVAGILFALAGVALIIVGVGRAFFWN